MICEITMLAVTILAIIIARTIGCDDANTVQPMAGPTKSENIMITNDQRFAANEWLLLFDIIVFPCPCRAADQYLTRALFPRGCPGLLCVGLTGRFVRNLTIAALIPSLR